MKDDPALLARQVDAGRRAESEPVDPVVEPALPELHTDLVRADVARDAQDVRDGQRLVAVTLSVVDLTVGDLQDLAAAADYSDANWTAVGVGANDEVNALAVLGGNVYAGGDFASASGTPANSVAKWNGSSWSELGSGCIS